MTQELISELNLALIPDVALADRHIALSKLMATRCVQRLAALELSA